MCGIAGFADSSRSPASPPDAAFSTVHHMCDVIRHRGPDDEGVHVEPGVGLGMRRLSIIDLSTGHQPIHNEDRTVWVVFNGEIYNYRELRRELEAAGHRFYTSSDTETIVHAYEEWGEAAFGTAARHVRASRSGTAARGRCCSRAIAPASSRCTTRCAAAGCTSAPRSSRCSPPARSIARHRSSRRSTTTCRSSTRRATAPSSRASGSCRPGTT